MKATKWAFRVAVFFALFGILVMLVNPVAGLLFSGVNTAFAWGLKRRQRWTAVAWLAFLLLPIPFAVRPGSVSGRQLISSVVLQLSVAGLAAGAALELWRDRTSSRTAWPWAAGVVALLAFLLCLHPYYLPTSSMEPTLLQGDYILTLNRIWGAPQRDELVVFRNPANAQDIWIKRVAAVPGDRLRIVNKQLYRNGTPVAEPYAVHETSYIDSFRDNFPSEPNAPLQAGGQAMLANDVRNGEVVVPAGQYFLMGDNRDNSLDSRYFGFVSADNIIGRPCLIYASYTVRGQATHRTAFNTRWNRLFKVL
jgi:signal peptidase I